MHARANEWRLKPVDRRQDVIDAAFLATLIGLVVNLCWPLEHYWAEYIGLFLKSSEDFRPEMIWLGRLVFFLSLGGVTYALFFYLPRVCGKSLGFRKVAQPGAEALGVGNRASGLRLWNTALMRLNLGRSCRIEALGYDQHGWWVRTRGVKKYVLFNQYSVRSPHLIILRWNYWPWSGILIRPSTLVVDERVQEPNDSAQASQHASEAEASLNEERAFRQLNAALAVIGMT